MISVTSLSFDRRVEKSVLDVIRSGNIAQGKKVEEFENLFCLISGTKHAVAVNNGTTSLIASLQVLNLGKGDEVITSPFTFIATLNAILSTGATAVMADIKQEDFNLDPMSVESLVTSRTRAIIPVHLYGQMADMIEIEKIALKNNLHIIEDSAQSHGASISGRPAGSFGLGSFSFYATKNLTTGEGGVITTNDGDLADALRILRNQGMRNKYEYVMEGNNYRLTDLQAALVIPQLKSYDSVVQKRKKNAATLSEKLQDIELITLPKELDNRSHVWHQYTILLDHNVRRDEFVKSMAANDVGVGVYYPSLVSDYELYRNHDRVVSNDVNVARDIASRVVSLPVHTKLKKKDFIQIANATRASLGINR